MYFIVKILGQARSIQNSVSSLNRIDDLNLGYWFLLYEKISRRWWFRDHCFHKTMRIWRKKDPQAKFLLISREDFSLPFVDKKLLLTRKMVLHNRIKSTNRKERAEISAETLTDRGISLSHCGLNTSFQNPCYAKQLKGFRASAWAEVLANRHLITCINSVH